MLGYFVPGAGSRLAIQHMARPIEDSHRYAYRAVPAERAPAATRRLVGELLPLLAAKDGVAGATVKWFVPTTPEFVRTAERCWPEETVWQDSKLLHGVLRCAEPTVVYLSADLPEDDVARTLAHELRHVKQHKGLGPDHVCPPDQVEQKERDADQAGAEVDAIWKGGDAR